MFIFYRFIKQPNTKISSSRVIFWFEMLHASIVERMKSVLIQNAMYRSAGDIYLLGNFCYTPSFIFFNDIQYCLFISQGPCGSCTSANFISIRQNFLLLPQTCNKARKFNAITIAVQLPNNSFHQSVLSHFIYHKKIVKPQKFSFLSFIAST
jgi:hypothetical protein